MSLAGKPPIALPYCQRQGKDAATYLRHRRQWLGTRIPVSSGDLIYLVYQRRGLWPDLPLAVTSFAVMVWANSYHREYSVFVKTIAPLLAGIGMAAVTALILINFNLMMDTEDFSMIWIMPAIILGSGLIGLIWGKILTRRNTMNSAHITGKVAETEPEPELQPTTPV